MTQTKELRSNVFCSYNVYYEDTDFSGYVYHAQYLKWFERCREEQLSIGLLRELYDLGQHFVVKSASIEYLQPMQHGQKAVIQSRLRLKPSARLVFEHSAYVCDAADDPLGQGRSLLCLPFDFCAPWPKAASSEVVAASIDKKGRPLRLRGAVWDRLVERFRSPPRSE